MTKHSLGWIGMGRMGYPMAERLLKAGHSVAIWNRTRAKAEPLAKKGGQIVDHPSELSGKDIVFTMVSTGKDLEQVYFGENGLAANSSAPPSAATANASRPENSPPLFPARRRRSTRCSLISRPSRPPGSPMSAKASCRASARSRTTSSSAS